MDTKISTVLTKLGFFQVLGTTERMGLADGQEIIKGGVPFTWDVNNGILVVYDELGWPWVTLRKMSGVVCGLEKDFNLKRGAFVPHSNDGGRFVAILGGVK